MRGTVTRQFAVIAVLAALVTSLSFLVPSADAAQRPFSPTDGTDCLVVTGTAPVGSPQVLGSRQPLRESYAENDELFIGRGSVADLNVGDRLQFVRSYGEIRHPDTGDTIAEAIGWIGFAEVIATGEDRAIVRITKSCREEAATKLANHATGQSQHYGNRSQAFTNAFVEQHECNKSQKYCLHHTIQKNSNT